MSRKRKKEKRPAVILRIAARFGYEPGRVMREVLEWIEVFVVAGALAALIMGFVIVRMHVPTGSMIPTIDPKDSFFVDRISYYFRDPVPGDIIVFRHTEEVLVKHVADGSAAEIVGIEPGERLLYLNETPAYNTQMVDDALVAMPDGTRISLYTSQGRWIVLGDKTASINSLADLGITTSEKWMRYVKRLIAVGGQTVQIVDGDVLIDGERLTGPKFEREYRSDLPGLRYGIEPTLVPEGHYFVLGDNSADSFDSRYWGFVDERDLIGEPLIRVWPLNRFGLIRP
jgi:signal peptidase I